MSASKQEEIIIQVKNINKTFPNGVKALVDFSIDIPRSEVLVVI